MKNLNFFVLSFFIVLKNVHASENLNQIVFVDEILSRAKELNKKFPDKVSFRITATDIEARFSGYDVSTKNSGNECQIYLTKHLNEKAYSFTITEKKEKDIEVISATLTNENEILKNEPHLLKVRNSSTRPYFLGYRTEAELSINGAMLELNNHFIETPFKQKKNSKRLFNTNNAKSSEIMTCASPFYSMIF